MTEDKDKDKEKTQEDAMLTTENDPKDEAPDAEPDAPEQPDEPLVDAEPDEQGKLDDESFDLEAPDEQGKPDDEGLDLLAQMDERDEARAEAFVILQSRVEVLEKREKKRKAEDAGYLVNPVKVIAGLALSAEQLSTFKQTFPYLF